MSISTHLYIGMISCYLCVCIFLTHSLCDMNLLFSFLRLPLSESFLMVVLFMNFRVGNSGAPSNKPWSRYSTLPSFSNFSLSSLIFFMTLTFLPWGFKSKVLSMVPMSTLKNNSGELRSCFWSLLIQSEQPKSVKNLVKSKLMFYSFLVSSSASPLTIDLLISKLFGNLLLNIITS